MAVLGDIGGHSHQLRLHLTKLGVTFAAQGATLSRKHRPQGASWAEVDITWPHDLHIVSVGDLIHRGPDSPGVVALVDRLIAAGVWTAVVGNHEQLYVHAPVFMWEEQLPERTVATLRQWWEAGSMVPAACVTTGTDSSTSDLVPAERFHVVTHAGLTRGFWAHLGRPRTTAVMLAALDQARADGTLWHPGAMLGAPLTHSAGPVWAAAGTEVVWSWATGIEDDDLAPFDQVHGHSSPWDFNRNRWLLPEDLTRYVHVDTATRHTLSTVGGQRIWGVDPCHLTTPAPVSAPAVFHHATVSTGAAGLL